MWRATAMPVKIAILDARACFPVLISVVYFSLYTIYVALFGVAFFGTISFLGLTLPAMARMMRRMLVGRIRPAVPSWKRRRFA